MSTPHGHSVVVGLDGSDASTRAAMWGAAVASKWGEPLSLAHAGRRESSPDGKAIFDTARTMLGQHFPDLKVETTVKQGSADTVLLETTERARLVVLGSTGAETVRSALIGSTALHVANRAKCPVVVIRGDGAPPDQRPVIVGLDGSELSREAANHAFEFASFFGAPLVAVHTWQGSPALKSGSRKMLMDWDAMKEEEVALLSEALAGESERYPDVSVTRVAEQRAPATAMMEHAEDGQLIVVGSHGRGRVLGALIGSTSQHLLHHANCPVMICRER
ncbi:universal stress protein [Rhodococcus sp. WMMA185]|uniref:universal stress protein n=1 Tax=Rhodococcus sp. WMMA185 TaxID=679318 RepID=UPI0008786D3C|nr:universal stress protein [Rhodococcus sp. WMMA185]AOW93394.1 universal stress protein [Rhodococcus sp. WMMA185]